MTDSKTKREAGLVSDWKEEKMKGIEIRKRNSESTKIW